MVSTQAAPGGSRDLKALAHIAHDRPILNRTYIWLPTTTSTQITSGGSRHLKNLDHIAYDRPILNQTYIIPPTMASTQTTSGRQLKDLKDIAHNGKSMIPPAMDSTQRTPSSSRRPIVINDNARNLSTPNRSTILPPAIVTPKATPGSGILPPTIATPQSQTTPSTRRLKHLDEIARNWAIPTSDLSTLLPATIAPRIPGPTLRPLILSKKDIAHITRLIRLDHGATWSPPSPLPILKYTAYPTGICIRNPSLLAPLTSNGWAAATLVADGKGGLMELQERERVVAEPREWSGSFVHALRGLAERTAGDVGLARSCLGQAVEERRGVECTTGDVQRAVQMVGRMGFVREVDGWVGVGRRRTG